VTHILLYLCPVVVMLLAAAFLGERLGRRRLAALGLAVLGVFAVVDPLSTHGSVDAVGFLVGLATAAINDAYTLAGRVLLRGSTAGHIGWRPAAVQRPHHSVYLRRRPGRPAEGVTVGRPQGRWPVAVSLLAWAASDEAVLDLAAGLAVSCAA